MNLDNAVAEFINYTNNYVELSDNCTLKIDHTFRVMAICEEIAKSLNLSTEEIELAKLCGLLHDIGRFEQWKNYQTFNDLNSVDHALLGINVLTNDNYIDKYIFDDKYKETVLNSIFFHNKYRVDGNIDEKDKLFCKIVRDADKIDILYLYTIGHIKIETDNEKFSDKVYNGLLKKEDIDRNSRKTKADYLAVSLGFIFDINFKKSFEILKEKGYIHKEIELAKSKNSNAEFLKQIDDIEKVINDYMKEMVLC